MRYWQKLSKKIQVKNLSLLQKLMLQHAEPVNFAVHIIAGIFLIYGLWINNLSYVTLGILLAIAGHLYTHFKK